MPQQEQNLDADFDTQLRGLFQEATQNIEERETAARKGEENKEQEITRFSMTPHPVEFDMYYSL